MFIYRYSSGTRSFSPALASPSKRSTAGAAEADNTGLFGSASPKMFPRYCLTPFLSAGPLCQGTSQRSHPMLIPPIVLRKRSSLQTSRLPPRTSRILPTHRQLNPFASNSQVAQETYFHVGLDILLIRDAGQRRRLLPAGRQPVLEWNRTRKRMQKSRKTLQSRVCVSHPFCERPCDATSRAE